MELGLAPFEDEPRVEDLRLAEVLEFGRPRDIRQLIERNAEELSTYGHLRVEGTGAVRRRAGGQLEGQEGQSYWLNEEQALLVTLFSRTERAAQVRRLVIDVFKAWRRGELSPSRIVSSGDTLPLLPPQHLKRSRDGETVLQVGNCIRLGYASAWRKHPARKRCRRFFLDCSTMEVVHEEDLFKPRPVGRARLGYTGR